MKFHIQHQAEYSRGELLLRTFFGFLYIAIPHYIGFLIFGIVGIIINLIATLSVLFTGKYPRNMFNFQVKMMRWQLRVMARLMNLCDGYPAWGLEGTDDKTSFDVPYPEKLNWGLQWVKFLFGFIYILIPHGIVLFLRIIVIYFIILISWFAVLFTGKYPKGMHDFVTGTLRWSNRVSVYYGFMSDKYPPFTAEIQPWEEAGADSSVPSSDVIDS